MRYQIEAFFIRLISILNFVFQSRVRRSLLHSATPRGNDRILNLYIHTDIVYMRVLYCVCIIDNECGALRYIILCLYKV